MISKNFALTHEREEYVKPILPGFPLSIYTIDFNYKTYNCIKWHWHKAFQLCLVLEGTIVFHFTNKKVTVSKGDGLFINYQQIHMAYSQEEPASYFCVQIPPAFLCADSRSAFFIKYVAPFFDRVNFWGIPLFADRPIDHEILKDIREIRNLFLHSSHPAKEIRAMVEVMKIWENIIKMTGCTDNEYFVNPPVNQRLRLVEQYIHEHYTQKITLDMLAAHISLSRSECSRFFNKATGQSFSSYLSCFRVNKSTDLLSHTDMSIAEVAHAVGFGSQSYYTETFRKLKNMTPKKYRELTFRKLDYTPAVF